jgi:hypothetical protein
VLRSFEQELCQASSDARRGKIWWLIVVRFPSFVILFLDGPVFDMVVVKRLKLPVKRYHVIYVIA